VVAVAVRDPTLARVVELLAEQRLSHVPTVFQGAALAALPEQLRQPRAFAFYLLGPFDDDWVREGGGLLAAAHALAVTIDVQALRLDLKLFVLGRWQPARDGPRLAQAWGVFAASSLGERLGLDRPLAPPELAGSEGLLSFFTSLDAAAFSVGLEALLVGNLDELLSERGGVGSCPVAQGYACPSGRRQDRPDGQHAFDVGGGAVLGHDRRAARGREPRGRARVQPSRHDQRSADLGGRK
jgi:hypothetical protein